MIESPQVVPFEERGVIIPINPYLRLFKGEDVLRSELKGSARYMLPSVNHLMGLGQIIGQYTLFDGDLLLWMPDKKSFDQTS